MNSDDETKKLLSDIRSYLRIAAAISSKQTAARVLDSYEKALTYTKLDGTTSTYKIADATGVPQRTVLNWADEYVRYGLASPPNDFYQSHRALFSLSELGIDLTTLRKRKRPEDGSSPTSGTTLNAQGDVPA